jgi:signal transduction histidine kinase
MVLSTLEVANLVLSFGLFAIGLLPLQLLLLQHHSRLVSPLIVTFGLLACGYAVLSIIETVPDPGLEITDLTLRRVSFLLLGAITAAYYLFVDQVLKPEGRVHIAANVVLAFGLITAIVLVWTDFGVHLDIDNTDIEFGIAAYLVAAAWLVSLVATVWYSVDTGRDTSNLFTIPGVVLAGAILAWFLSPYAELGISLVFVLAAAVYLFIRLTRKESIDSSSDLQALVARNQRDRAQVVTELSIAQKELELLRRNFQEANQYRAQFLANMSHELRTPLNSIIGYTELLRDQIYGPLNEKQADRLERIHRNGYQLLELVTDILDLNELDKGKLYLSVEALRLEPLLKSAVEKYGETCAEKGLECQLSITDDLPHVFGDRQQIARMVENLLDNAIKFTEIGSVTVSAVSTFVKSGQTDDIALPTIGWLRDGGWVIIAVKDTGIGIPAEDQSRIFDVFIQLDGSRTRAYGGTGVGLAIVKRLSELHGGAVWVKSNMSEGSEFFVALPSDHQLEMVQENESE